MRHLPLLALLFVLALPLAAAAQEQPVQDAASGAAAEAPADAPADASKDKSIMPLPREILNRDGSTAKPDALFALSLMFSPEEITQVVDVVSAATATAEKRKKYETAMESAAGAAAGDQPAAAMPDMPGAPGAENAPGAAPAAAVPRFNIPLDRKITLSGVFYRGPSDWVVWLNGQKVTPRGDRPRELVAIKVERDRVHLKWFDIGMGKIISLTLRPRQTYDIVSGVLLPG